MLKLTIKMSINNVMIVECLEIASTSTNSEHHSYVHVPVPGVERWLPSTESVCQEAHRYDNDDTLSLHSLVSAYVPPPFSTHHHTTVMYVVQVIFQQLHITNVTRKWLLRYKVAELTIYECKWKIKQINKTRLKRWLSQTCQKSPQMQTGFAGKLLADSRAFTDYL